MREVFFGRNKAAKQFDKIDSFNKKRVIDKLVEIQSDPDIGDPLTGDLLGFYKFRFGKYRIVYSFTDERIDILSIENRDVVYDELKRYIQEYKDALPAKTTSEN